MLAEQRACLDAQGSGPHDPVELVLASAQHNHSLLGDTAVQQVPAKAVERA